MEHRTLWLCSRCLNGSFFIMTPEFQGEIVRNAVKLAKVSNWCNLLKYITNEVYMDETI